MNQCTKRVQLGEKRLTAGAIIKPPSISERIAEESFQGSGMPTTFS